MSQTASIFYSDTDKDYECWCPSCGSIYGVWDENDIDCLKQGEDVYVECGECGESFYINDDNYVLNS